MRVQWSRADEHGWEPEGVAMLFDIAGGIDADGRISAGTYAVWTPTHSGRPSAQPGGSATLVAGAARRCRARRARLQLGGERNARHTYVIPNTRDRRTPAPVVRRSARRRFRGLGSPQNSFANESFMDELAVAAGADPVEFRLRHLTDPRAIAVVQAVAARLGELDAAHVGRSARRRRRAASTEKGAGFGYVQYDGTEAYVAAVVDVDVDVDAARVRVTRVCVAHDCGLIVNPDGLRNQIEGNVIQAISRTLKEAVRVRPLARDERRLARRIRSSRSPRCRSRSTSS